MTKRDHEKQVLFGLRYTGDLRHPVQVKLGEQLAEKVKRIKPLEPIVVDNVLKFSRSAG